jgi:hypothetical protein
MGREEYQDLLAFLERLVRRRRRLAAAEGACLIATVSLVLFALGPAVAHLKTLFPYAPLGYLALALLTLALLAGGIARRLLRRTSVEAAALYVESQRPQLKNNLINSLELYPQIAEARAHGMSVAMVLALLRATRRQLAGLEPRELVSAARLRTEARRLALLAAPVLALVLFHPASVNETFSLLVRPLADLPAAASAIEVEPKSLRILRGGSVTIRATVSGALPPTLRLEVAPWEAGPAGRGETLPMRAADEKGRFEAHLGSVAQSLRFRAFSDRASSPWHVIEVVDAPEIGRIRAKLHAPHYTGLAAVEISGGNIEGIRGSNVTWEAEATKEVARARLLLEDGRELPLKIEGRRLKAQFVLFQSQRYRVEIEDRLGFKNSPVFYELRARPDGLPTVEILRPGEEVEVNGDETLLIEFDARDDFGLLEVNLLAESGGRQEKIAIQRDIQRKSLGRERFQWELAKLGFPEPAEVVFQLEALDNDTVSGPKRGLSRPVRLRFKDLRAEQRQLAETIRELSRDMIDLLGDHLESLTAAPPEARESERGIEQRLARTLEKLDALLQRAEKERAADLATYSDLEALRRNLRYARDELLPRQAAAPFPEERGRVGDEIATELERMALLSEEIKRRLDAEQLSASARDVMRSQERLLEAMEKLRSGDRNLDAVLKEISELAKLLSSMQQALSQLATRLPDEFMNAEALQGVPFGEMLSALEQIRRKLLQGDIEGAMQLARELFHQLASMVAALQNAQRSAMASSMGRMQGEMMRSANELEQILREQQEILRETEAIDKSALERADRSLKQEVGGFHDEAYRELARLAELFPDDEREGAPAGGASLDEAAANHLAKGMIERLLKKDFAGLGELLGLAEKELAKPAGPPQRDKSRQAQAALARLRGRLAALGSSAPGLLEEEKKGMRELAHRQEIVRERTEELKEKLESLFQLFPSLDPRILKEIGGAEASMAAARRRLAELDARGAVPPERDALSRLAQSQQQMQSALQQMAQRGQLGHLPVSVLLRRGRFLPSGTMVPLPGTPAFPEFDVHGGITGLDTERFRLPGKEDYRAPRSLREEILESLKQGVPPRFKEQVESYFRNLSE